MAVQSHVPIYEKRLVRSSEFAERFVVSLSEPNAAAYLALWSQGDQQRPAVIGFYARPLAGRLVFSLA